MKIPTKKLRNGFEMPIFGLGTWQMGGKVTRDPSNDDEADITAIKNAIEAGIAHIDTAEKYAEGHAESLVGRAIEGYDRKKLFLVSKVAENHLSYTDVAHSLNASLERMRTPYLDLYMIHGPNSEIPLEETMRALDEAVDKGFVKYIAVSNFTVEKLKEAQSLAKHTIVAGQYHLNLKFREAEKKGVLEYCQTSDKMFIAWRPVQKGFLSTNTTDLIESFCKKYDKTPSQIAINWLISQKNIVTLSKMRSAEHLTENLGALDFKMESEDIKKLRSEFPDQQDISDAVPLR
jgi:diketogulonate reductase-like aldo/keto reductase